MAVSEEREERILDEITPQTLGQWALYVLAAAVIVALSFAPAATCSISSSDEPTPTTTETR